MRKMFRMGVFALLFASGGLLFGASYPGAQMLNLPAGGSTAIADDEDEKPDVTARVARISFIRGEVKIKRLGNEDWERAVLNLPLIEGDEISTGADARVELQLNSYVHLRLDHDAFLKFSVMKDEGVAVSISQGTISLRVTDFPKAGGYFEIDAPKTTVAVEKSGSYRVDAGDSDLHVSVNNGGSARVYSESAGFTLKSGRGARVFIDGQNAGEWETAESAKFGDDFDAWSLDRDSVIAKRLAAAHYDKYYDQDIYGAEDLNDSGEWIYTSTYGYVWRPYTASLSGYPNWSPYRYGHWRWVGAFGWTWVNDEPWGWATYHHGRWIYDNGYWVWCPYGYYRPRRSWWFPAVVSINIINNNICWYPLGYRHRWHNYNGHHGSGWSGSAPKGTNPSGRDPRTGGVRATPTPLQVDQKKDRLGARRDPRDVIPASGVVAVDRKLFGTGVRGIRVLPEALAREALSLTQDDVPTVLPDRNQLAGRMEREIIADRPPERGLSKDTLLGAAVRKPDTPLDTELRTKRIFGERRPVQKDPLVEPDNSKPAVRTTGAVDRPIRSTPIPDTVGEPVERKPIERKPRSIEGGKVTLDRDPRPDVRETKPREQPRVEPAPRPEPREEPVPKADPPARREPPPQSEPAKEKPVEKPVVVQRKTEPKDGG